MWPSAQAEIEQGYAEAREVCRRHAKSFFFASTVLFGARRRAAFALYAVCRALDDIVDEGQGDERARLARAEACVRAAFDEDAPLEGSELSKPQLAAFRHSVATFGLRPEPLLELVKGMEMDLFPREYASWAELERYCYRVAGTVGEAMAPILGCTQPWALQHAIELGEAMQLTNILRDVKEDLGRGRLYLPLDELARFGVDRAQLEAGRVDDGFRAFMQFQIARARGLYERGALGLPALEHAGGRATARVMGAVYAGILGAIERAEYDVFRARAHVPMAGKLALAARALFRPSAPLAGVPLLPAEAR